MVAVPALIDATAVPADRGGVGRYVDGVIAALDGPFFIACQARDAAHYATLAPSATVLPQRGIERVPLRLLWEQFALPQIARSVGATVIHSPHYTLPLLTRRRRVVTLHDATFFSDPAVHTALKRLFFSTWIRVSVRLADALIVPSRATADELARFVRSNADDYVVAYHGVDPTVFHQPDAEQVTAAASTLELEGRPWIAFLGTIEPRKNVPFLIAAYRQLVSEWDDSWGSVPVLAIAGGRGWETGVEPELALVEQPAEVRELGFIELADVTGFLGGAELVAYPSSGEGFGLPVLEGMACGAPVLTTTRLALPEVGGDAVQYAEPTVAGIHEALRSLVSDPALRADLAARGPARAALFTWTASALVHAATFERVAANA